MSQLSSNDKRSSVSQKEQVSFHQMSKPYFKGNVHNITVYYIVKKHRTNKSIWATVAELVKVSIQLSEGHGFGSS